LRRPCPPPAPRTSLSASPASDGSSSDQLSDASTSSGKSITASSARRFRQRTRDQRGDPNIKLILARLDQIEQRTSAAQPSSTWRSDPGGRHTVPTYFTAGSARPRPPYADIDARPRGITPTWGGPPAQRRPPRLSRRLVCRAARRRPYPAAPAPGFPSWPPSLAGPLSPPPTSG
jgi:hypothetical protein